MTRDFRLFWLGESVAQVAGPGAGGLLAQAFGAVAGLLADALTFAISAACLLTIRHRGAPARGPRINGITPGVRFLAADPYLRVLAAFGAVANLALTGYQAVWIVFLVRDNDIAPGTVGVLAAMTGTGGALATTWGTRPTITAMATLLVLATGILLLGPLRRSRDLPCPAAVTSPEPAAV